MNKLKLAQTLSVLLLTFCAVNSAQATVGYTLGDLVNSNNNITVDDKVFSGWTVSQTASDNAFLVNLNNIGVDPLPAPGGNPLVDPGPGLAFTVLNNGISVAGDGIYSYLDLTVSFLATVTDTNNYIKDVSSSLTSSTISGTQDLGVFIQETVSNKDNNFLAATNVGANILNGIASNNLNSGVSFTPQSEIQVTKNILIWSAGQGETVSLNGFEQHFSQTQGQVPVPGPGPASASAPEPTIMLLLSVGFLAAGFVKRRQV